MWSRRPASANGSEARRARHRAVRAARAPPPRAASPPGELRDNVFQPDDLHPNTLMAARLRAPGFYRATLWMVLGGVGFAMLLTWLVRMANGHTTYPHYLN